MSEQFFHGLRLLVSAPVLGLVAHGALFIYSSRKARRQAAATHAHARERRREKYSIIQRLLPKQRIGAVYAAALAGLALLAAMDASFFTLRFLFGLVFLGSALVALRLESRAKQSQKDLEVQNVSDA